jgi:excisionase family DNA binding protein
MEPMGTMARLHTVEEVMERLCVGRSTAFGLIASRQLRSVKVGRRRLVSEAALVEFIENLDRQTSAPEVFGQGRRADAQ